VFPSRRALAVSATVLVGLVGVLTQPAFAAASATSPTTAWSHGQFVENTQGVVDRSDVVLGAPNYAPGQSLALGNGRLGVSAWAAGGFTAQLNRDDTMPARKSPGDVQIPGLAALTGARDFHGRLDLYDGVLTESGGGMTAKAWVPADTDELVVDVTGADPTVPQTASVSLWAGRTPTATASGAVGTLAETWVDNTGVDPSGQTFGSLAGITAGGRQVSASVTSSTQVTVRFTPNPDGSYRIIVAAPQWAGGSAKSTAQATATTLLARDTHAGERALLAAQQQWWHGYWAHAGLIEASSADGTADYLENVRTIYLYVEALSMRGTLPGSQAGVADLVDYAQDQSDWDPSAYWLWNLRTQLSANMSSGNFALNTPIFDMYLRDIPNLQAWTMQQMSGHPGICVPETMRFNGNGTYNGGLGNASCSEQASPSYNALDLSSGPEIATWIWQQYQDTHDLAFLRKYYPLLQQTATFLLSYQTLGSDGLLHAVANAHETQWAVQDPTTDIVAMRTLFPETVQAAALLHVDKPLSVRLSRAETEIPDYPRTDEQTKQQLLPASADATGTDVIADSYQPAAPLENGENIGLEPVWPWDQISDQDGALTQLADRTYTNRPNVNAADWSLDAIDAARLDLPAQVEQELVSNTERYQSLIGGLAKGSPSEGDPYLEQSAGVATALDEALVQDYDGTLRIAPGWPTDWSAAGTVYIQGGSKVDVQVQNGVPTTVAIEAGSTGTIAMRNPWQGKAVQVVDGRTGRRIGTPTAAATLHVALRAGASYLVEPVSAPTTGLRFGPVTGTAATSAKHLGPVQIGLDPSVPFTSLAASFNDVGISDDTATNVGNYDGNNASFSAEALAAVGATPGAQVASDGLKFIWPNVPAGTADNTVADGQTIDVSGSGAELGFLLAGSSGGVSGSGQIVYTDGTVSAYTIDAPDWFDTTPPAGGSVAVSATYQNRPGNTTYVHSADVFAETVPLDPGRTVAQVILPAVGPLASGVLSLHIFGITIG
jgi:hypothetical protein